MQRFGDFEDVALSALCPADSMPLRHSPDAMRVVSTIRAFMFPGYSSYKAHESVQQQRDALPRPVEFVSYNAVHPVDLDHYANEIVGLSRASTFVGPPGIGKSTKLPFALQKRWGKESTVILLEPTDNLARHHYENLCSMNKPVVLDDGVADMSRPPEETVIISTPGKILSRVISGAPLPQSAILQHDEDHENDYLTVVLKAIWPGLRWVKKYVTTTATSSAGDNLKGERARNAKPLKRYAVTTPLMGDVHVNERLDGYPAPWSAEFLHGKRALVFMESDYMGAGYAARLGRYMPVAHIHGDSNYDQIREALEMAKNADELGCVIVADSTLQTGYNIDVDYVIDMGLRKFTYTPRGGAGIMERFRYVTEAEARQRAERVGRRTAGCAIGEERRTKGASRLAEGEIEHAAVLLLLMGYEVPEFLAGTTITARDIADKDLDDFFRSRMPWAAWDYRRDKTRGVPAVSMTPVARRVHFAEQATNGSGGVTEEAIAPEVDQRERTCRSKETAVSVDELLGWADRVEDIAESAESWLNRFPLQIHKFYCADDGSAMLSDAEITTAASKYGGVVQWLRRVTSDEAVLKPVDMSETERRLVLRAWLTLWNNNCANMTAMTRLISSYREDIASAEVGSLTAYGSQYRSAIRDKVHAASDMAKLLQRWVLRIIEGSSYRLHPMEAMEALIEVKVDEFSPRGRMKRQEGVYKDYVPQVCIEPSKLIEDHVEEKLAVMPARHMKEALQTSEVVAYMRPSSEKSGSVKSGSGSFIDRMDKWFTPKVKVWRPGARYSQEISERMNKYEHAHTVSSSTRSGE